MQTAQKREMTLAIPREKLVNFVRGMVGGVVGYEDPDNPLPPGPWDPYIRKALRELIAGPVPDPWTPFFGPGPQPWREMSINPQLPPKPMLAAAVAREVIDRAVLMQEIADALQSEGQQHGIIIVGGLISRFIEDCGNDRLWPKRPIPPPHGGEPDDKLTAFELVAMGAQFEHSAMGVADSPLQQELRGAGAKLIEMGVARM